ncbi:MAG: hypothetical protein JSU95_19425 [Betaproteobacteria bacterium]|nr:MAG: hypothetical protein JSU95_19425 [Betaproteobacteria bacterium]
MWPFKVKITRTSDSKSQFAEGYQDGKKCQQEGVDLTWPLRVGTDEYSKGFRTAYYMHAFSLPTESNQERPAAH